MYETIIINLSGFVVGWITACLSFMLGAHVVFKTAKDPGESLFSKIKKGKVHRPEDKLKNPGSLRGGVSHYEKPEVPDLPQGLRDTMDKGIRAAADRVNQRVMDDIERTGREEDDNE